MLNSSFVNESKPAGISGRFFSALLMLFKKKLDKTIDFARRHEFDSLWLQTFFDMLLLQFSSILYRLVHFRYGLTIGIGIGLGVVFPALDSPEIAHNF